MTFEMPAAPAILRDELAAAESSGHSRDLIGAPLDAGVNTTLPEYDTRLALNLAPKPDAKRHEVCHLPFGAIRRESARLRGLGLAIEHIAGVVRRGRDQLAHDWRGDSFDAFRAGAETLETTLNRFGAACQATANGLDEAVAAAERLFTSYRDTSVGIFAFENCVPYGDFFVVGDIEAARLAAICPAHGLGCEIKAACVRYATSTRHGVLTRHWAGWYLEWDGEDHAQDADLAARSSDDERTTVAERINSWYEATDTLSCEVKALFDTALANLQVIVDARAFAGMTVPGTEQPARPAGPSGGPGGSPGGGPSGGPQPGTPTWVPPGTPADLVPPTEEAVFEPGEPPRPDLEPGVEPGVEPPDPEKVTITVGDLTLAITGPGEDGMVELTVTDATGAAQTYELDFGPLPGTEPPSADPAAVPESPTRPIGLANPDHVPIAAGPDGSCVVDDGSTAITAVRPEGAPNTVRLTVVDRTGVDGTGVPATYTVDFGSDLPRGEQDGPRSTAAQAHWILPADGQDTGGRATDGLDAMLAEVPDTGDTAGDPDRTDTSSGEAGLASAPDQPSATGPAGGAGVMGGMPMMGAMGAGGGGTDDRTGPGRIAGDLFDDLFDGELPPVSAPVFGADR